jgi:hypothetical protein
MPLWTIRARRNLRQALADALCRESADTPTPARPCLGVLEQTMDRLNDILAATFPGQQVVIKDQMIGYRRKKDTYVLLVEVFGVDNAQRLGPYVVKIGPAERIEREIKGWECCKPPGLRSDLVFLELQRGTAMTDPPWTSLVYGDAQQFLGVAYTVPFETAALEAVRTGFPRVLSVCLVIVELFERIGFLLYSQGYVDDPSQPGFAFELPELNGSLDRWTSDSACQAARRDVNTLARSGAGQFLDPVDYLDYTRAFVPWIVRAPDGSKQRVDPAAPAEGPAPLNLPRPEVRDLVPRMLRGCSHGDLHGRNVLVGIVRQRAMWPTVFDYEDMAPCNLIGWDFVKFETELKIRAYLDVFSGKTTAQLIEGLQQAEIDLNEQTEQCHLSRNWPEIGDPQAPEERLRTILLMIRRMASEQLGESHFRPNDWLEEYYFLLACYGTYTSRFENLQMRERYGALISAGVAAARLSWPRRVQ